MQVKTRVQWWIVGFVTLLCLCGKSNKPEVVYGPDSLSSGKIRTLMAPDASPDDPAQVRQTLFRYSLAKMSPTRAEGQVDSAAIKLARRMTLETGKEWSPEAASLLLRAATALETRMRNGGIASVIAYVDSVFAVVDNRHENGPKVRSEFSWLDTMDLTDAKAFKRMVSAVFGVSPEVASTLASFIDRDPQSAKDAPVNINKTVRGILSKKVPLPFTASHAELVAQGPDQEKSRNALRALKFRPQQSIRDSIARHLPDLEVIYKKQLKLNEMSGGLVWVVFRVDAEGSVLSAKIKSSAIANRQFQQLLEEYVRTIHFKAIPKDVGPMIFEFSFEFKSEG